MKILYFLLPLFLATACKTPSEKINSSEKTKMEQLKNVSNGCPTDGTCEVVIHKNKKLELVNEGNDRMYSQMVEGENLVIEYTYLKSAPKGIADGNYFETIQFEVPVTAESLVKENKSLADVNLIFSKFGNRTASYHPVTEGKLSFKRTSKTISFNLQFKVNDADQVVSRITETVEFEY
ncbi:hypothetical protein [Aequorivita viscosa]|uniref:Lipoprotein n=1 Tax=Aequorivita viscosa TaxID=797419 RepID=A0A1M6DYY6_9FLAO|nr:hypothetical protein [Aequorivita viscosa]SDW47540.1 hypothetical protein SAMN05216556_10621 [Aequorivita viscosa]SHI78474.1 hypothetical protein SAMN04487908_105151 [Aequorivita viscosa]